MPKTYMFTFTPDAQLAVIEADMPQEDAVAETGKTIKLFGWREGILRAIYEIEQFIKTGELDRRSGRVKLYSTPKTLPNGKTFAACTACGYSPAADKAMFRELVQTLDDELKSPPEEA